MGMVAFGDRGELTGSDIFSFGDASGVRGAWPGEDYFSYLKKMVWGWPVLGRKIIGFAGGRLQGLVIKECGLFWAMSKRADVKKEILIVYFEINV